MFSISENENNLQSLQDQIVELEEDNYKHKLKSNQHEADIRWITDLIANSTLSGEEKITFMSIWMIIKDLRYDLSDPVHIWTTELVNRTGLGSSTIRKITNRLHDLGLVRKETKGRGKEQRTWYSIPSNIIHNSKDLAKDRNRNRGGLRKHCEKCGSENIDVYTAYECRDCGHIHTADIEHRFKTK